jgi:hypothetical protein
LVGIYRIELLGRVARIPENERAPAHEPIAAFSELI